MLSWFRSQAQDRRTAIDLYGATVTQARRPPLFSAFGAADTAEGRTSVIILHLYLMLDRLKRAETDASTLARLLTETFITDIDDCLREMGVGDLTVPKKIKRVAQAMGERCIAYQRCLEAAPAGDALAAELALTIPGLEPAGDAARRLAQYVIRSREHLAAQPDSDVLNGRVTFLDAT
ncbi:MAG: ubiquinol-cytochrome C chaperone family protein [Hyphomicrobium sp.]